MIPKTVEELGRLQSRTLEVLWALGEGTVHQVREELAKKDKALAYTTVLTTLQKLEKAGWVHHRPEGRSYVYIPAATKPESLTASTLRLVKKAFGGDPLRMFRHLLEARVYSEEELDELRKMIAAKRKKKSDA
jgi:BlaI family penicillinase repressor